jgi:hypothetical protein
VAFDKQNPILDGKNKSDPCDESIKGFRNRVPGTYLNAIYMPSSKSVQ